MRTNSVWLIADAEGAAGTLREVLDNLDMSEGEVALDFSSVRRVDTSALAVMQQLASKAGNTKVVLRGVNVDVYRVLKLVKLSSQFTFVI